MDFKNISNDKSAGAMDGIGSFLDSLDQMVNLKPPAAAAPAASSTVPPTAMAVVDSFMGPPVLDKGKSGGDDIMKMLPQLLSLLGM